MFKRKSDFKKIVHDGLVAKDVVAVKVNGEKRELLAILCESLMDKKVYAVIQRKKPVQAFFVLGCCIDADAGDILKDWVTLDDKYLNLKAPGIVVDGLRKVDGHEYVG